MEAVAEDFGALHKSRLVWTRRLIDHLAIFFFRNDRVTDSKER